MGKGNPTAPWGEAPLNPPPKKILPKSNSAKNNFFENITIKLFWRVDFPLPQGAKPLDARGEATSVK